jgi:hypothetical protein
MAINKRPPRWTRLKGPIDARIVAASYSEPTTGCWLWSKGLDTRGYGHLYVGDRLQLAHRVSWEAFHGPIPDGLCVLHKCDTPSCVNCDGRFVELRAGREGDDAQVLLQEGDVLTREQIAALVNVLLYAKAALE